MAQEITATNSLLQNNAGVTYNSGSLTQKIDQTGNGQFTNTQNVGFAAEEVLLLPGFSATLGMATFRNLDLDNFVEVGLKVAGTFDVFMKLKPSESGQFRLSPSKVYYAKADTAAVDLNYTILED